MCKKGLIVDNLVIQLGSIFQFGPRLPARGCSSQDWSKQRSSLHNSTPFGTFGGFFRQKSRNALSVQFSIALSLMEPKLFSAIFETKNYLFVESC